MLPRKISIAVILCFAWMAAVFAAQPPAAAVRLQQYLDGLSSFEAEFKQVQAGADGQQGEQTSGRFWLLKPGKFRWEYLKPNEQTIVSDGTNLWLYDKDLEQVTVKAIGESLATTPALLLAGKQNIAQGFDIAEGKSQNGVQWLKLTPKRNDTDFVSIELGFAAQQLAAMRLADKLGQTTRIDFSVVRRNPTLAATLFSFQPPAGVDIIGKAR